MSSASTPVAVANNLVVEGVSAQAPRGLDEVAEAEPRLTWRTTTDAADWTQHSAELELSTPSGTQTATVEGSASVLVDWPFAALAPRDDVRLRVRVTGRRRRHLGLERAAAHPGRLPGRGRVDRRPDRPGRARRSERSPDCPDRVRDRRGASIRDSLRDRGRGLPGERQRRRCRRPGDQAGLDAVPVRARSTRPPTSPTCWSPGTQRDRHPPRRRLGDRALRLPRQRRSASTATQPRGRRAAGDRRTRTAAPQVVATDDVLAGLDRDRSPRAGIYPARTYDARLEPAGLGPARLRRLRLVARPPSPSRSSPRARGHSPVVRRIEELPVREVITTPSGRTVLDFGQNLVGRLRLPVDGPAGTVITLRHAEVLEHGELGTRPLRPPRRPTPSPSPGTARVTWEPEFTFHGFRYAEVDGWPGELDPAAVTAAGDPQRHGAHRLVRQLARRWSTGCTRTWSGACAATSSTCPPTARSATSGWAGPATSRCSPRPRPSSTTCAASSTPGCPTWRSSRSTATASCRSSCRTCCGHGSGRPRPGATPRPSCRRCCTSGTATPACWPPARQHAGRGPT